MSTWYAMTTRDESKTLVELATLETVVRQALTDMKARDLSDETFSRLNDVLASIDDWWPNYVSWQERIDENS